MRRFQPIVDERGRRIETSSDYLTRMKGLLPAWPGEVLAEWLYRHSGSPDDYLYAPLDFTSFQFQLETWPLGRIPGREAFRDAGFLDAFQNLEVRAEGQDWLALEMMARGTWHTPPILLENTGENAATLDGEPLGQPHHLLEGHRRLSFVHGLRRLGRALPEHKLWVVRRLG